MFMCVYSSFSVVSVCLCSVYELFSSVYCELGLILQAFDMHQDRQIMYNVNNVARSHDICTSSATLTV